MDRNGLSNFANVISKFSKTSPHNHHRNTRKSLFMTIILFRQKTNKQCNYPITLNGKPVHDEYVKCNLFNKYFASISNSPAYDINKLPPFHFLTDHRLLPPNFDPFQVFRVLSSLHPNKWLWLWQFAQSNPKNLQPIARYSFQSSF